MLHPHLLNSRPVSRASLARSPARSPSPSHSPYPVLPPLFPPCVECSDTWARLKGVWQASGRENCAHTSDQSLPKQREPV